MVRLGLELDLPNQCGVSGLTSLCFCFQMLIFCEGTRFTEEKHKLSMEFAAKKGLKPLKHHLMPRTGGFHMIAKGVRDSGKIFQ